MDCSFGTSADSVRTYEGTTDSLSYTLTLPASYVSQIPVEPSTGSCDVEHISAFRFRLSSTEDNLDSSDTFAVLAVLTTRSLEDICEIDLPIQEVPTATRSQSDAVKFTSCTSQTVPSVEDAPNFFCIIHVHDTLHVACSLRRASYDMYQ